VTHRPSDAGVERLGAVLEVDDATSAAQPQTLATKAELGAAIFEWIEAFYNPIRGHADIGGHSPAHLVALHTAIHAAA